MNEKLKPIKIIHLALCAGIIVAYVLIGDIHTLEFLKIPDFKNVDLTFLFFPIAAVIVGQFLYRKQLKNCDPKLSLEEKIPIYQTASIMRWALLEGAAFAILFIMPDLKIIGVLLLLYLMFLRPSEDAMKRDFAAFGQ